MIAVIQRVSNASVSVDKELVSSIGKGFLVLAGLEKDDTADDAGYITKKITELRIFEDGDGRMNLSIIDTKNELLVVSQFTLAGNVQKGRRPGFDNAMEPQKAEMMFNSFIKEIAALIPDVKTGRFGAKMEISLINDGPVTFIVDSKKRI